MGKLIAYCGLDCAQCGAYLAKQNNDQALRVKTAAEWKEMLGLDYSPETMNCDACKGNGELMPQCAECEIRKCATGKSVVNCGACEEFSTCKKINDFIEGAPYVKENLI